MKYNDIKDSQKQEAYLSKLMKNQFDQELKDKWAQQLKTEYAQKSTPTQSKEISLMRRLLPFVAGIAACVLLFVAYNNSLQTDAFNPNTYIAAELSNPIVHPGNTKGIIEDSNMHQNAIAQFNEQNYTEASQSFSQIGSPTTEDQFYQAMSYFYLDQSENAIPIFEQLETMESSFSQEINWYLGLSYLSRENVPAAKKTLSAIQKADWNYTKAQEIVEAL